MSLEAEFAFVWEALSTGQHNVAKSRARPAFETIKKRFLALERQHTEPLNTRLGRVSCTFVVNGEPIKRTLVAGQTLRDHVIGVLKQTKNDSDPRRSWEARDALGSLLDLSRTVDSYASLDQCPVIYVTLPVGAGANGPPIVPVLPVTDGMVANAVAAGDLRQVNHNLPATIRAVWNEHHYHGRRLVLLCDATHATDAIPHPLMQVADLVLSHDSTHLFVLKDKLDLFRESKKPEKTPSEATYATYGRVQVQRTDYAALAEQVSQVFPLVLNRTPRIAQIVDNAVAALGLITEAALRPIVIPPPDLGSDDAPVEAEAPSETPPDIDRYNLTILSALRRLPEHHDTVLKEAADALQKLVSVARDPVLAYSSLPDDSPPPLPHEQYEFGPLRVAPFTVAHVKEVARFITRTMSPDTVPGDVLDAASHLNLQAKARPTGQPPRHLPYEAARFSINDVLLVSRSLLRVTNSQTQHEAALRLHTRAMALSDPGAQNAQNKAADPLPPAPGEPVSPPVFQGLMITQWAAVARALWSLLDDIDTAADSFKPTLSGTGKRYFDAVTLIHKARFKLLTPNDDSVLVPVGSPPAPEWNGSHPPPDLTTIRVRNVLLRQIKEKLNDADLDGFSNLVARCLHHLLRVSVTLE